MSRTERLRREVFETLTRAHGRGFPFWRWTAEETAAYLAKFCPSLIEAASAEELVPFVRAWREQTICN